jgi:predicted RNase H-like nuclease
MKNLVVGIDVGGPAKGFHAVALRGGEIVGKLKNRKAGEIAAWCVEQGAEVVAVDAPCLWRRVGKPARAAERQLAQDGISCFSTPTEAAAKGHAFYTWMFAGMDMFHALAASHPLYLGQSASTKVAIETFPQAIACALAGEIVSAKEKNRVRRELLTAAGIDERALINIDEVDAALCALAAQAFARRSFHAYGDTEGGFIVVPAWARRRGTAPVTPTRSRKSKPPASRALAQIITAIPSLSPAERKTLRDHLAALEQFPLD